MPAQQQATVRWHLVAAGGLPPCARQGHSATVVPERGWIVVFGGANEGGPLSDLFVFDVRTHTWSQRKAQGGAPAARSRHAAVYVPARDSIYVFGGTLKNGVWG